MDWPVPAHVRRGMGLPLVPVDNPAVQEPSINPASVELMSAEDETLDRYHLVEQEAPGGRTPGPTRTAQFKAVKMALHPDQDARNKVLGLAGERLILLAEQRRLVQLGRPELAERIVHVLVVEGDGAGYDIRSFSEDGRARHIEVKTTRNAASASFFVSPNELAFSETHPDSFELVRVYHFDASTETAKFYRLAGPLSRFVSLVPTQFRASLLGLDTEAALQVLDPWMLRDWGTLRCVEPQRLARLPSRRPNADADGFDVFTADRTTIQTLRFSEKPMRLLPSTLKATH
ncbi:DUF3883 domain-containing protein [Nakamurella deserti]|uniref:DUF3883 domain-containing protein n=1 Tax=Nakamurella deserti TaxID=2164074 RepID=UPI003B83143A